MFTHLHVHTHYSLLDGASDVRALLQKTKEFGMEAIAITDHGNMFGVPEFVKEAEALKLKPIIGCEFYLAPAGRTDKKTRTASDPAKKDKYSYHQLILAKNSEGYRNLCILNSKSWREGYYYYPRIDKELLKHHHTGLIATTGCIASEIPRNILYTGEGQAEKLFLEYLEIFGDDFYIELQKHNIPEQEKVNEVLVRWSGKYNVKVIATNDVHYIEQKDSEVQDILLCLKTGKFYEDTDRMRFKGDQFYLKSADQMKAIFSDHPDAIINTSDIVSKVEPVKLNRKVMLPTFSIPDNFQDNDGYLRHLTYKGAGEKFPALSDEIRQRLDFELEVIQRMEFAGYFLIVRDFIHTAVQMGVRVGPARGSVAGSLVAYCIGITGVDPIKYNLLFERFLNPERISMPDIDIDFDEDGRQKVIDYVVNKYGKERVAQLVTFNMIKPKLAIRDVGRVLKLPLNEADRLAKLVPEKPDMTFRIAYKISPDLLKEKEKSNNPLVQRTLEVAERIEGTPRHKGVHAAGIIIAPVELESIIPLTTVENTNLAVTQYEGTFMEDVGMLKMDFLGLTTLSVINDTLANIKETKGILIDTDAMPLDDEKTFELFRKGEAIGIFQFESDGMRTYLKELKPTNIEDLIAMNALYRPGAMDDIPVYIRRKNGIEKITYPHSAVEPLLKPTFGVIVYQEQVMLIVQKLAGFTKGEADTLRKAMSKKRPDQINEFKEKFIERSSKAGLDERSATDLFDKLAKFGGYGFNRSHSAGYALLAYQTAYLKANYPCEYMAALLSREMSDIENVEFYMNEARRMNISVLNPDVNESGVKFTVNKNNEIRFALSAIKNVGTEAVHALVKEKNQNGLYRDIYDFASRVNLQKINKRCVEAMVLAGAFDSFGGCNRAQYFYREKEGSPSFIEQVIRFGSDYRDKISSKGDNLFGKVNVFEVTPPPIPACPPWSKYEQLQKEKEIAGIYISGHPLDDFSLEINAFCNSTIAKINMEASAMKFRELTVAGIVTESVTRVSKTGKTFCILTVEDYTDSAEWFLFGEDYLKYKHLLEKGGLVLVKGRIQPRFNNENMLEFRVLTIKLLADAREQMARSLLIRVPLERINDTFIKSLMGVLSTSSGKVDVEVEITDNGTSSLKLFSRKIKTTVTDNLLSSLHTLGINEIRLS
ncbi:MAG: DNA polymerase III subunit alpha [Bacteroidetes bacterium]|nr:DNA polymerase III subunit alpha [Bacteroidota bacterium]